MWIEEEFQMKEKYQIPTAVPVALSSLDIITASAGLYGGEEGDCYGYDIF